MTVHTLDRHIYRWNNGKTLLGIDILMHPKLSQIHCMHTALSDWRPAPGPILFLSSLKIHTTCFSCTFQVHSQGMFHILSNKHTVLHQLHSQERTELQPASTVDLRGWVPITLGHRENDPLPLRIPLRVPFFPPFSDGSGPQCPPFEHPAWVIRVLRSSKGGIDRIRGSVRVGRCNSSRKD